MVLCCLLGKASKILPRYPLGILSTMCSYTLVSDTGNVGGLEGRSESVHRRKKSRVFPKDLFRPLGMETGHREVIADSLL